MKTYIETETYAIINNLDKSIININPFIENDGYTFIPIKLNELELNFSELFNIPHEFKPNQYVIKGIDINGFYGVSSAFEEALKYYFTLHPGNDEVPVDNEVYLLKKIDNCYTEKENDYFLIDEPTNAQIKIKEFAKDLIMKLRLFKSGQIEFQGYFSIFKDTRKVITKFKTPNKPNWGNYVIEDKDLPELGKLLRTDLNIPNILNLAIQSFEQSYSIYVPNLRFIMLMVSLESIYNRSSQEPISHIISRHLALTLTNDKAKFEEIYRKTKKLYSLRSKIIHGNTNNKSLKLISETIEEELVSLEDLTRQVFKKILSFTDFDIINSGKDALFDYLNNKGVS